MADLNTKQEMFCKEYLIDLNATQAAIRAGYSEATAGQASCRLLKNVKVEREIERLKAERSDKLQINAEWVLNRLVEEADADMSDLYTTEGSLKSVHKWPEIWRKGLVSGLETHQEYTYQDGQRIPDGVVQKMKLSDRLQRIKYIGEHVSVNAFKQTIGITGEGITFNMNFGGKDED